MQVINAPIVLEHCENFLTASIGVAFYPEDGLDSESLITNADIAMYEAKHSGRNTYKLCSTNMKSNIKEMTTLRNNLYKALERNEFRVFYQPQIDTKTGQISGFEALLRWEPQKGQFISPAEFIPIAEETGLIVPIGFWVIKSSCSALKSWHEAGFTDLTVAVNLSYNQLRQKDFIGQVSAILKELELNPCYLELEITERIAINELDTILPILQEIKSVGIKLSIDDFGTEYSSFVNIKKFPVDIIKIDMQFIRGLPSNPIDTAIVSSIINLFHSIGMSLIAEGVEKVEQLDFLREKNCDKIQGYYFYKPMPYGEIENVLRSHQAL